MKYAVATGDISAFKRARKFFRGAKEVLETEPEARSRNTRELGNFSAQNHNRFDELFELNSLVP